MLCGARIEQRKQGWHNPEVRKVVCTDCWGDVPRSETHSITDRPDPIGGSSALKWAGTGGGSANDLTGKREQPVNI